MPAFKGSVEDILATFPASTKPFKQFVLFGDSITQGCFDQSRGGFALGAQLVSDYSRRVDVVNRGLNGYQTEQGLAIIDYVFPSPDNSPKIDYLSLFFGANDSAYDECGKSQQLVSIDRYRENLISIVTHPSVQAHNPRIILVTPPPVDEHQRPEVTRADGTVDRGRDTETTAAYARVAKEVGEQLIAEGKPVVICDLWTAMMKRAGWTGQGVLPGSLKAGKNPAFAEMMYDGLHFNPAGYKVLYDEMRKVMAEFWPDSVPENMDQHFPNHLDWFQSPAQYLKYSANGVKQP
ncbi:GDSL Lipase/Acylhydrolase family protein [Sporormia fimetaria CBS 119925]|uniref:GDSL Lipase/Acylhydrolase family protein n=1 Tax=Sporormia fimetaria CBS 119925 TaxID=1340428 RepID=A0A6A6V121_9PLEO|nr:GDSL Lipase/Acylhydrolase family protein [Sporormia fimetaria CBS 119925]